VIRIVRKSDLQAKAGHRAVAACPVMREPDALSGPGDLGQDCKGRAQFLSQTFAIVLSIFGLIGLGYGAARSGMLAGKVGEGLTEFVFKVAMPVLLFDTLAAADLHGLSPWRVWTAYFGPFAAVWAVSHWIIRRGFRRDARAAVVGGGSAAYSNAVLVGIPLILGAFGQPGVVFLIVVVAVHLPVMMLGSVVLNEWALRADQVEGQLASRPESMRRLARSMLTNPILLAIALGLLWRSTGVPLPNLIDEITSPLAGAAGPLALFASGMSLVQFGMARQIRPAMLIAVLKLVLMPLLVLGAATALGLPPVGVAALTLTAACPTGVNAFLIAGRLGTGQALASNALLFSTAGGVVTVAVWLTLLSGLPS
jgi:malonate transporter and related proteins